LKHVLENKLIRRNKLGNLRELKTPSISVDFSSNDYLGLAQSSHLLTAVLRDVHTSSPCLGSTGSRLLTGNSLYAQLLEEKIAHFHGYASGTLFGCGYLANLGLLSALSSPNHVIFFDTHVHASIHDGIRLSKVPAFPFKHNDINHLEYRLKNRSSTKNVLICLESVYSTDGSVAPLVTICQLAEKYGASVIVDEAHAVGVLGPEGRGLVAAHGLQECIFAQVVTFGKALGTYGAIVLGKKQLQQALINFAHAYIYTTALPFLVLKAITCSYETFPKMETERAYLQHLITLFRANYPHASPTHIQAVKIPGNAAVKQAARYLEMQGFDIRPLLSPTVQKGHEILRISLHAFNTEKQILHMLHHLTTMRACDA